MNTSRHQEEDKKKGKDDEKKKGPAVNFGQSYSVIPPEVEARIKQIQTEKDKSEEKEESEDSDYIFSEEEESDKDKREGKDEEKDDSESTVDSESSCPNCGGWIESDMNTYCVVCSEKMHLHCTNGHKFFEFFLECQKKKLDWTPEQPIQLGNTIFEKTEIEPTKDIRYLLTLHESIGDICDPCSHKRCIVCKQCRGVYCPDICWKIHQSNPKICSWYEDYDSESGVFSKEIEIIEDNKKRGRAPHVLCETIKKQKL